MYVSINKFQYIQIIFIFKIDGKIPSAMDGRGHCQSFTWLTVAPTVSPAHIGLLAAAGVGNNECFSKGNGQKKPYANVLRFDFLWVWEPYFVYG